MDGLKRFKPSAMIKTGNFQTKYCVSSNLKLKILFELCTLENSHFKLKVFFFSFLILHENLEIDNRAFCYFNAEIVFEIIMHMHSENVYYK